MRIIICDDDIELTQELKKILVSFFQKNSLKLPEISIYNNGQDLLNDTGDKDIVFLDIEMPGMNGIYIGNELKQKNKNTIIFVVTSYSQYLDEAMRFNVFRYLSKPLDKQRISGICRMPLLYIIHLLLKYPLKQKMECLSSYLQTFFSLKHITIKQLFIPQKAITSLFTILTTG